jgi:chromosome segregation ATPase
MKIKIGIIVLAVICAGLFIALFATKKSSDTQRQQDAATILQFSNDLGTANINLNDRNQVILMLTNDIASARQLVTVLSNNLMVASTDLSNTKAALQTADDQIVNLNGRIADLEAQNKALDERANELTNRLAELDALIIATQQKLANAEADNAYLTAELQKQMAQKAELQRKFNDLNVVRAQVKQLREELFVAQHLEWIKAGTSASSVKKGAELLTQRSPVNPASVAAAKAAVASEPPAKPASPYDLNVEVGSDGSVHVIPAPAGTQDNSAQAAARAALLKTMGGTNSP